MTKLHTDFESASVINLKTQGLDRYMKASRPLMLAWAFDDDEPELWEPHLGPLHAEVIAAAKSDVTFCAWNSGFERNGFFNWLGIWIPYERWEDPSTFARSLSLPGSLQDAGDILGLGDDGKGKEGKRLIKFFCEPLSMGGEQTLFGVTEPYFRDWSRHPEEWKAFGEYCKQDVRVERRLAKELEPYKLTDTEYRIWCLDQKINDTGLPVNRGFVEKALKLAEQSKAELKELLKVKTGLENPNSRDQMLKWCGDQKYPYSSLEKGSVTSALAGNQITPLCREVLTIRKEAAKNSYKKLEAVLDRLGEGDRLRNQYLYLGAARSGRWSGSGGVQVQNMPRPTKEVEKALDATLHQIEQMDYAGLKAAHPSVITAVSSCIRSSFQAPPGKTIIVCDLNAIENRVLGWMAGCDAILEVFRKGRDPYLAFAALMYGCKYEDLADTSVTPHKPKNPDAAMKRQIAKPAVLGLGYHLGPGVEKICKNCGKRFGYKTSCSNKKCRSYEFTFEVIWLENDYGDREMTGLMKYAADMGVKMTPQQAYHAWYTFRQSYPEVVQLWKDLEAAAKKVLLEGGKVQVGVVAFDTLAHGDKTVLRMLLPSGRALHYWNAQIKTKYGTDRDGEPYEKETIQYDGIGHGVGTVSKEEGGLGTKFGPTWTYSGKLCENGDQAISRDVFAHGMLLVDAEGAEIFGHSHDEGLVLADEDGFDFNLCDMRRCMSVTPWWGSGLPLEANGFESRVYKKG